MGFLIFFGFACLFFNGFVYGYGFYCSALVAHGVVYGFGLVRLGPGLYQRTSSLKGSPVESGPIAFEGIPL